MKNHPVALSETELLGAAAKDLSIAHPLSQMESAHAQVFPEAIQRLPEDILAVVNDGDVWLIYRKPE